MGKYAEKGTLRYFRNALNRRNVTVDVKHFEDCKQRFISIGRFYLIEALLHFVGMDSVDGTPERNDRFSLVMLAVKKRRPANKKH